MLRTLISILFIFITLAGHAQAAVKPLPAEQAFIFGAHINNKNQLILEWHMAPAYYLYRDKINIVSSSINQIKIGKLNLPAGITKKDTIRGIYQIYFNDLIIPVALLSPIKGLLSVTVHYQGCSKEGFCYPPFKKDLQATLSPTSELKNVVITSVVRTSPPVKNNIERIFDGASRTVIIFSFLMLGLLLAFTPCVLPMVPILSGIILGHKNLNTTKAFSLSLAYVLGMAITYAIAGVIVALVGSRIQTMFQTPLVIALSSGLFVLLALSLFGFYELALPSRWQQTITSLSNRQKGGTYAGVFLMGVLSSLIVSPCVSAPLVGVLTYIAQTGNVVFGGLTLLALGIGMGIPLLLMGVSAGKFLPKTGAWMQVVERLFGFFLLALAIWMFSRIIPGPVALLLWAILFISSAAYVGVFSRKTKKISRGFGFVILVYGILLMIGAILGNANPLHPLEGTRFSAKLNKLSFVTPHTMAEFNQKLAAAKQAHQPIMLDFYADWCVECVKMDRYVFTHPSVSKQLTGFLLLRADVTHNTEFDKALLKRFQVVAPPTLLFFNSDGEEQTQDRIVGGLSAKAFLKNEVFHRAQ